MLKVLLLILLAGFLAWFWMDSLRARESANAVCRMTCQRYGVQFLDHTVALQRLALRRDPGGRLQVLRQYGFEYSEDGDVRHRGHITLLGARVQQVRLPTLDASATDSRLPPPPV